MALVPVSEDNPFQSLIAEVNNDSAILQSRYENHRVARNSQQSTKILADSFPGWSLDEILKRLDGPEKEDGFVDPRNCLVIWARPSPQVRDLICFIQNELKSISPSLWLMPPENLHITILEAAHSLTEEQIQELVQTLLSSKDITPADIAAYPRSRPTRLIKPMVSFDSAALALSFVPAAGECLEAESGSDNEKYSYHHLRRDVFELVRQTKVPVASRYIVPSAHLTIARFISQDGIMVRGSDGAETVDHSRVKLLVDKIGEINQKLEDEYWPKHGAIKEGGRMDCWARGPGHSERPCLVWRRRVCTT
ncbi:RNA ligase/cyclic nucleotide phosphodiesterase [Penicillium cf. griseofulvum]|uniref:RNA ligase/cyclic nucleotide phosphodiesterase n=1 Tax=Penicillium cf. griseofulvum TaxID=2972120 RepID=A0A9W9JUL2_9EURO|nr:RNA ligase/cyclic nucleotide phosphodiesterase [Penicillium cf. griseofulvum]KAJ5431186.1 RNA ligase/cyclic nucleotide phosphodiesterase [Penicillium cf. griseofulvum]